MCAYNILNKENEENKKNEGRKLTGFMKVNKIINFGIFQMSDTLFDLHFNDKSTLRNESQRIFFYASFERIDTIYKSPRDIYIKHIIQDLKLLHQNEIFHLDIADRNILLSDDGPVLIDFLNADNENTSFSTNKDESDAKTLWMKK